MLWTLLSELKRIWPLLVIIGLSFAVVDASGAQLAVTVYNLSMMALVLISGHLIRKALFPYLDLGTIVQRASRTPTGSGLVAFGMFIFLCVMLYVGMVK